MRPRTAFRAMAAGAAAAVCVPLAAAGPAAAEAVESDPVASQHVSVWRSIDPGVVDGGETVTVQTFYDGIGDSNEWIQEFHDIHPACFTPWGGTAVITSHKNGTMENVVSYVRPLTVVSPTEQSATLNLAVINSGFTYKLSMTVVYKVECAPGVYDTGAGWVEAFGGAQRFADAGPAVTVRGGEGQTPGDGEGDPGEHEGGGGGDGAGGDPDIGGAGSLRGLLGLLGS